jgi:hypothetical protein
MERYTIEQHQAHVEAEEKRKAEEEQARRERSEKAAAKRAWVADSGAASDFEKAWPGMRDQARRDRILNADQRARQAQRQHSTI